MKLPPLFLSIFFSRFILGAPELDFSVLSPEDIIEETSQVSAALSSVPGETIPWESFNVWQCFHTNQTELLLAQQCDGEEENRCYSVSLISVLDGKELLEFALDDSDPDTTLNIFNSWQSLIASDNAVCLYSAKLQEEQENEDVDFDTRSNWVLTKMKTHHSQWSTSGLATSYNSYSSSELN